MTVVATACGTPCRPFLRAKLSKWAHTDDNPSTIVGAASVIKAAYRASELAAGSKNQRSGVGGGHAQRWAVS